MGNGIAQICAQAGYTVMLMDIEQRFIDSGMNMIRKNLSRDVQKGRKTEEEINDVLARITPTIDLKEAAGNADVVVEVIIEVLDVKKALFRELEQIVPDHCLFFSNTSGISITEMAAATKRPDRFIGTHFFNPVPVMKLLEIIKGYETTDETYEIARKWGESLGKEVIVVNEAAGFAVNRILCPMLNEAFCALETGVASAEDIDRGMTLGCNHPIGPLALSDMIGLDTLLRIMEGLQAEFGDKYLPSPLLRKLVRSGNLGRKTGKGVYEYGK
jgi:3-hydroxybutyryl-CoA dehydrogenase